MLGASDCEAIVAGLLHQPVNALSSLAFVVAGIVVALRVRSVAGWLVAGSLGLAGVGSLLYHGPMPSWAELLHDMGILAVVFALGAIALPVLVRRRSRAGLGRRLVVPVLLIVLAVAAAILGRTGGVWCRPDAWWQVHAAWHVFAAAGVAGLAMVLGRSR